MYASNHVNKYTVAECREATEAEISLKTGTLFFRTLSEGSFSVYRRKKNSTELPQFRYVKFALFATNRELRQ